MNKGLLALTLGISSCCWADVLPTVTQFVSYTGNASAQATDTFSLTGNIAKATIQGQANSYPGPKGGQAEADITMQGEFVAAGTGTGFLVFTASGNADGSGGAFSASYFINDQSQSCLQNCGGAPVSEKISLGVPFLMSLMGTSYAYSGNFAEDAAYNVGLNFDVTDANGKLLALTEIPLPTPEPQSLALIGAGLTALVLVRRRVAG